MTAYSKIDRPEINTLLFSAQKRPCPPCPAGAEDVSLKIGSGTTLNCRYYSSAQDAPLLFIFPATTELFSHFDNFASAYLRHGLNLFLASYRGFSNNDGSPSVSAILTDCDPLFQLAVNWLKEKGSIGPIFLLGQSLGSVCAIDAAWKNSEMIKGLIIESGIVSTLSFFKAMGTKLDSLEITEEEGFRNIEKIAEIKAPTLIFHGAADKLVPVAEAEKLQAASGARTKQFFIIPGAEHHNIGQIGGERYIEAIRQFTDTVCGVNTWRQKRREHKIKRQGGTK